VPLVGNTVTPTWAADGGYEGGLDYSDATLQGDNYELILLVEDV